MTINKLDIKKIVSNMGLPKKSKYLGYIIHLPVEDEFLGMVHDGDDLELRGFTKSPEIALKFTSFNEALTESQKCKGHAEVWLAFDIGSQVITCPADIVNLIPSN